MTITTLLASEHHALATQAEYTHRLSNIQSRLDILSTTPSAITDHELRNEFTLLTENKKMLEVMLDKIPQQLAVLRQSLPLAMRDAEAQEKSAEGVMSGLQQWRSLAATCQNWILDGKVGEVPRIVYPQQFGGMGANRN